MRKGAGIMLIIVGALAINLGALCKGHSRLSERGIPAHKTCASAGMASPCLPGADACQAVSSGVGSGSGAIFQCAYGDCEHKSVHSGLNLGRAALEPAQPGHAAQVKTINQSFANIAPVPRDRPPCISV